MDGQQIRIRRARLVDPVSDPVKISGSFNIDRIRSILTDPEIFTGSEHGLVKLF